MDFACSILESRIGEPEESSAGGHNLAELKFGQDGDRQLVESILNFSRMLLQIVATAAFMQAARI